MSASSTNARLTEEVRAFYEEEHERGRHRGGGRYWHRYLRDVLAKRIPAGQRVLDIGCGTGEILAALQPSHGVGIDLSQRAVDTARARFPKLQFHHGDGTGPALLSTVEGTFDVILVVNAITHFVDVQAAFEAFRAKCHPGTRLFVYSYSRLWQPVLALAETLGLKGKAPAESWLPPEEVRGMLALADFEVVRRDAHVVCPVPVPWLADLTNRYVGRLPGAAGLSLLYGIVARPAPGPVPGGSHALPSLSVIVPCRNES